MDTIIFKTEGLIIVFPIYNMIIILYILYNIIILYNILPYIYYMYNIITIKPLPNGGVPIIPTSKHPKGSAPEVPIGRVQEDLANRRTWRSRLMGFFRGGLQGCPKTFTDTYAYAFMAVYVCIYTYMYIYNFVYRHVLFYLIYISIYIWNWLGIPTICPKLLFPWGNMMSITQLDEHHTTWWFSDIQCGHPPVISCFINPINYSYEYHKSWLLEL